MKCLKIAQEIKSSKVSTISELCVYLIIIVFLIQENDSTRQASNSNQRKPSEDEGMDRNKSVKRVRFSETRLEIDQEDQIFVYFLT